MTPPRPASAPRRPAPAPQRPDHLRVIPGGSAPGRRPQLPKIPAWKVAALSFGVLCSMVLATLFQGQLSIEKTRLERSLSDLRTRIGETQLQIEEVTTPGALALRARRLGLVFPDEIRALPVSEAR